MVTLTVRQLSDQIGQGIPSWLIADRLRQVLPAIAQLGVSDVKKHLADSRSPDGRPFAPLAHGRIRGGSAIPLRDRGFLLASINGRVGENGIAVGTNLEYAGIHNFGGTIVPKRTKFLAIPLTIEALRAGSPRRFPRPLSPRINKLGTGGVLIEEIVRDTPQSARDLRAFGLGVEQSEYDRILERLGGQPQKRQRTKKAEPQTPGPLRRDGIAHYALTKSVKIPARQFLGFSDGMLERASRIAVDVIVGRRRVGT